MNSNAKTEAKSMLNVRQQPRAAPRPRLLDAAVEEPVDSIHIPQGDKKCDVIARSHESRGA